MTPARPVDTGGFRAHCELILAELRAVLDAIEPAQVEGLLTALEIPSRQIMTSLFEQALLLFGDAVSLELAHRRGLTDMRTLWERHANLE